MRMSFDYCSKVRTRLDGETILPVMTAPGDCFVGVLFDL